MAAFIQFADRQQYNQWAGLFVRLAGELGAEMGARLVNSFTLMVNWSDEGKTLPYHPMTALTCAVCRIVMKTLYRGDSLPAPRTVVDLYGDADEPIEAPQCGACGVRSICRAQTILGAAGARRYAILAPRN
jgi:hypothetical protein